jgi:hypothetical protein
MTTQWVTMDVQGNIYYSLDGSAWSTANNKLLDYGELNSGSRFKNNIFYQNGMWVATGSGNDVTNIIKSTDGITWENATVPTDFTLNGVNVYGRGNIMIAVGETGIPSMLRSTDGGDTWNTVLGDSGSSSIQNIVTNGSVWLVLGATLDNSIVRSTNNGVSWTSVTNSFNRCIYASYNDIDNVWVAIGTSNTSINEIHRSTTNGSSWTTVISPFDSAVILNYIHNNGSTFIVVGIGIIIDASTSSMIRSSDNGNTWSIVLSSFDGTVGCAIVKYANSIWVAGGEDSVNGLKYSTDDGVTWNSSIVDISPLLICNNVFYNGSRWVAVGSLGGKDGAVTILYSDDGINWETATMDTTPSVQLHGLYGFTVTPCFIKGTQIPTTNGIKLIEDINENDIISNIKVEKLLSRDVEAGYPVITFKKHNLTVSEKHMININNEVKLAKDWINGEDIIHDETKTSTKLYHILLENNEWRWININGILAETLHPNYLSDYQNNK